MSWVNENARIEQALRVECFLRCPQRLGEQRRALPVIPPAVIAPDRVVVRDSPAIRNHGVERRTLGGAILRGDIAHDSAGRMRRSMPVPGKLKPQRRATAPRRRAVNAGAPLVAPGADRLWAPGCRSRRGHS
jgi:hypothetical protein